MANQLPSDLLAHIFIEGSKIDQKHRHDPKFRAKNQPEFRDVVTWIYQTWRSVALDTTQIWGVIDLSEHPYDKHVARYIARSGPTQPLDIYLKVTRRFLHSISRWDESAQQERIIDALFSVVAFGGSLTRWRTLDLYFSVPAMPTESLLGILRGGRLSTLETFNVVCNTMPDSSGLSNENVNEIPVSLGLSLPRLRFVHLSRFNMDYVFQNAGDNTLSNLSSLELGCIDQKLSLSGLGPLLERNPNLRVLCLNLGNDPRPFENMQWYTKTVSLPSLESLSLKNSPSLPWVQGFLTKLNAPNVKMLCLTVHRNDVGSWSTILNCPANGQQNSPMFPQLRRLSTNFRSEQLGPLLCAYPDLQRLDLLLNHDLTCLVILGRAPWLVPRLTQLWATQTNDRFALEMIQNRLEGGVSVPNIQSGPMGYSEYFA